MKMRLVAGVVVDLAEEPEISFHPEIAAAFVDVPPGAPANLRPGYGFDAATFTWLPPAGVTGGDGPPAQPVEPVRRFRLTPAEFRHSFSAFEEVAILDFIAGKVDGEPAALSTARRVVDVFFDRLKDTRLTFVDVSDPRNLAGLDLLVSAGLITAERRGAIAAGVVD